MPKGTAWRGMSGYLCCAACLHAIREDQEAQAKLVASRWYHGEHAPVEQAESEQTVAA